MKIKYYMPIIVAIVLVLFILFYNIKDDNNPILDLGIKYVNLSIPITSNIMLKIVLTILSVFVLSYYLFMDITIYFSEHLEMDVFYDKEGIQRCLTEFGRKELKNIGYKEGNLEYSKIYYEELDQKLRSILSIDRFYSLKNGVTHANGRTTFFVDKIKGIHTYHINESNGELAHTLEEPGELPVRFKSYFEKLVTVHDYIRPKLLKLILSGSVIIEPRFKQILAEHRKSEGSRFDHTLVGATKIYTIPYPKLSDTIYFVDMGEKGLVPIGYAVYRQD